MNKNSYLLLLIVAIGLALVAFLLVSPKSNTTQVITQPSPIAVASPLPSDTQVLGARTKLANCVAQNGLPDPECTPGAVIPTATKDQICVSGYSNSVRNVPTSIKNEVFREYNIATHQPGEYEVDHLISLELGGSNDISNLFPEAAEPRPGYHEKDKVENYLHKQVCDGVIYLQEAQQKISKNWLEVYNQIK